MTKYELVKKNLELSADFNSYLLSHPNMLDHFPDNMCIVFQLKGNKIFSEKNAELARSSKKRCYYAAKSGKGWKIEKSPLFAAR